MTAAELSHWWPGPSVKPVQPARFIEIEAELGFSLPSDFKDILAVFGLGAFGELHLYHPDHPTTLLQLPQAIFEAHELFQSVADFVGEPFPARPTPNRAVLGMLLPRQYLVWEGTKGWKFFDSELTRWDSLGSDLPKFLDDTFRGWRDSQAPASALALAIWGAPDGANPTPFFTPAQR